jgi:hypothetical protein
LVEFFKDLDHYAKVKMAYDELATFVPGQGGLQYYPVPEKELKKWQEQRDKKAMDDWLESERRKKKELHNEFIKINKDIKTGELKLDEFIRQG